MKHPLRIAILGTRGIPANYGGFETFAEELSTRLVKNGHHVTVYCRTNNISYDGATYQGVHLVKLPTIAHKYLDTVFHTFLSMCHILFRRYDILLMCNAANSPFCLLPRLLGKKVLLNVDGIERKRQKWNWAGRLYYRLCEQLSVLFSTSIVSDSQSIRNYYLEKYGADSPCIAYGARTLDSHERGTGTLERFGVRPGKYFLYVSRLEPENNAHVVLEAFEKVQTDMHLVIVGSAPYSKRYIDFLHSTKDRRVIFTGGLYGQSYMELRAYPFAYVQATEVGGTHPALVEGMGAGNAILFKDVPEQREVVANAGIPYDTAVDLREKMQYLVDHKEETLRLGGLAKKRARQEYSWDRILNQYEDLFYQTLEGSPTSKDFGRRPKAL